jgi:transposase
MTPQQANVIRSRFTEKARRQRLKQFMKQETPKQFFIFLQPFADDITVLQSKGYTIKQIVGYLAENGVQATESSVRNFLRKRA